MIDNKIQKYCKTLKAGDEIEKNKFSDEEWEQIDDYISLTMGLQISTLKEDYNTICQKQDFLLIQDEILNKDLIQKIIYDKMTTLYNELDIRFNEIEAMVDYLNARLDQYDESITT